MAISMLEHYFMYSKADKYIIGFINDDDVYYVILDTIPAKWVTIDKNSSGVKCLRLKLLTTKQKKSLLAISNHLCSLEHLHKVNETINNFGYTFEKLIWTKYKKTVWKRDSSRFYEKGDMQYKGIQYQIKFERATLTNIDTLSKCDKRKNS